MAGTSEKVRTETTYVFEMTHSDFLGMMNDPQVLLEGGNVDGDQEFQMVLKKSSGAETLLKVLTPTDTLVLRYTKVATEETNTTVGDIDVEAV
jgi:hypothetical protein